MDFPPEVEDGKFRKNLTQIVRILKIQHKIKILLSLSWERKLFFKNVNGYAKISLQTMHKFVHVMLWRDQLFFIDICARETL